MLASLPRPKREDGCPVNRLRIQTLRLDLAYFERHATELARSLLGKVLIHGGTAGMIVETEAYLGLNDLAAHASRGLTERTKVLFGPAGRAYIYFIYGMHECLNVVADKEGPGSVLIRALQPLSGIEEMYERRKWKGSPYWFGKWPGQAHASAGHDARAVWVRLDRGDFTIREWRQQPVFEIATSPRIGISECRDWPLRFVWKDHPCLSRR